ncbi:Na/Pi cotransporter family protein [Aquabacter sp. L1I39]|uniref:Na/Pi cotransporter family protein n=1 Tax=Aquabacter sp. L1I39 TaxID=2820278 RepID=UPI001ADCA54D|nr:Na/Pi symporter [Aquabacter sp. L1I39]QTL04515.1 Na/Pi cotransporter family protein [Aquabacter sp. L1I39]
MLIIAELLAGLGLLFIGLKLVGSHLQAALGHRIKALLKTATSSVPVGFACGTLAGAVIQSSNAVTLITANLVRSAFLTTREAVSVVGGANVGTSVLVFLAAINVRLAVLYLLALIGMGYQFKLDRAPRVREWLGVLLGLALLFMGLDFIKTAPKSLPLIELSTFVSGYINPVTGMALGIVVALITQSSSTAAILVLPLVQTGLMTFDDAVVVVLGANVGSGLATLWTTAGLAGTGKQLCYVHVMVKVSGTVLFGLVWIIAEKGFGIDAPMVARDLVDGQDSVAISTLFLVLQVLGAVVVCISPGRMASLAARISPPTHEDHISQPTYIHPAALEDPSSALELAAREARHLQRHLPGLIPDLDQRTGDDRTHRAAIARGASMVSTETELFLTDLMQRGLAPQDLDFALRIRGELVLMRDLRTTLSELSDIIDDFDTVPPLAFNLSESLRALTLSLVEAEDAEDLDTLSTLTGDRSGLMERHRRAIATSMSASGTDLAALQHATGLFERAVWLLHRIALTLRAGSNAANAAEELVQDAREQVHAD